MIMATTSLKDLVFEIPVLVQKLSKVSVGVELLAVPKSCIAISALTRCVEALTKALSIANCSLVEYLYPSPTLLVSCSSGTSWRSRRSGRALTFLFVLLSMALPPAADLLALGFAAAAPPSELVCSIGVDGSETEVEMVL